MKAPDIIYTDGMNTCATRPVFSNIDSNIKYIRADLAELTWIDIKSICRLKEDVELDVENGFVQVPEEIQFKEVLRRFLENKRK